MKKFFSSFIENISLIAAIAIAGAVLLLFRIGIISSAQVPTASLSILIALTFFVTVKLNKIGDQITSTTESLTEIEHSVVNITSASVLSGSEELFRTVNSVLKNDSKIDVTSFSDIIPTQGLPGSEIKKYWKFINTNLSKNNNFRLRRIAYVPSIEKFIWIENTITETNNSLNYHLSIIATQLSFPLVNMFIIDEKYLFLFGKHQPDRDPDYIFIDNKSIAKSFLQQYEEMWRASTPIKVGNKIYQENIDNLKMELNN